MDAGNISEKDRMLKEKEAEVFSNLIYCFTQCKGILDCLGFCIPRKVFRNSSTVFRTPILSGIPDSLSCIPDCLIWGELFTLEDGM